MKFLLRLFDTLVGITQVHQCKEEGCNNLAFWQHTDKGVFRCTPCATKHEGREITPVVLEHQRLRTEVATPYRII